MNFVAIDFETATSAKDSACSVGIVTVKDGLIFDQFHTLIKPPQNFYNYHNTRVHGINADDTFDAPDFSEVYSEIKKRLKNQLIVAHNESFDRGVLMETMNLYGLDYSELNLKLYWECTVKIFRKKGYKPANLAACCQKHNIPLNHHDALSDALACAKLFLIHKNPLFVV